MPVPVRVPVRALLLVVVCGASAGALADEDGVDDAAAPAEAREADSAATPDPPAPSPDDAKGVTEPPVTQDPPGFFDDVVVGFVGAVRPVAGSRRHGLGVQVGYPTAITGKLVLPTSRLGSEKHALDVSVGAFSGLALTEPCVSAHAGWLYHPFTIVRAPAFDVVTHVGAGVGLVILPVPGKRSTIPAALWYRGPTQVWTSGRFPVGVDLALDDAPVDIFFEVAPSLLVFPGLGVGSDITLGARAWW